MRHCTYSSWAIQTGTDTSVQTHFHGHVFSASYKISATRNAAKYTSYTETNFTQGREHMLVKDELELMYSVPVRIARDCTHPKRVLRESVHILLYMLICFGWSARAVEPMDEGSATLLVI